MPDMDDVKPVWECSKCLLQTVWQCTQFWATLSISTIVIWLLYRPFRFHPHIDSAILYGLNVTVPANATGLPTLRYDLAVDMSFHNSHRSLKIRYLDIGATAFYGDSRLGPANEPLPAPFIQRPKNTNMLHPVFHGTVTVDSTMASMLENELKAGTVHVRVSISLTIKYKVGVIKEISFHNYDCWIWFPTPRVGVATIFDAGTQCWESM